MDSVFYRELPEDYVIDKEIDAKDTKTAVIMSLAAALLCLAVAVSLVYLGLQRLVIDDGVPDNVMITTPVTLLLYLVYVVLHEFAHGAVYKY